MNTPIPERVCRAVFLRECGFRAGRPHVRAIMRRGVLVFQSTRPFCMRQAKPQLARHFHKKGELFDDSCAMLCGISPRTRPGEVFARKGVSRIQEFRHRPRHLESNGDCNRILRF